MLLGAVLLHEPLVEVRLDGGALERVFPRASGIAARKEPKLLPRLGQHEVDETLRGQKIWSALQNANAVGGDCREVGGQRENHVRPPGHANLAGAVKVDREGVGRFAQGHVFGGRAGEPVKAPRIAADLRQYRPGLVPSIRLKERLEHDVHRAAVARIPHAHPAEEFRVG